MPSTIFLTKGKVQSRFRLGNNLKVKHVNNAAQTAPIKINVLKKK